MQGEISNPISTKFFSVNLKHFSEATSQSNLPLIVFLLWLTDWQCCHCVFSLFFLSPISHSKVLSSQGVPAVVLLLTADCQLIYLKRCPIRRVSPTNHRTLITSHRAHSISWATVVDSYIMLRPWPWVSLEKSLSFAILELHIKQKTRCPIVE